MKKYYIAEVNVTIDGKNSEVFTITGMGYDPNIIKSEARARATKKFQGTTFACVILTHRFIDLQEYQTLTGTNPPWIFNTNNTSDD